MCYAIPAKIISIEGNSAEADYGGVIKKINVSLINSPKKGDFVLIHTGFAIEKLDKKSAEDSLRIIKEEIMQIDATITKELRDEPNE